jgi:hypothetical protein
LRRTFDRASGRTDFGTGGRAMAGALRTIATMCPMNCHPTLCGMLVDVRDGHLAGVRGDKDNPDSQGFPAGPRNPLYA